MDDDLKLTPAQKATLDKFKLKVKDIIKPEHEDWFLVKWLHARSWDLDQAEKMFRDDLAWRKENDIDNILTSYEPPEVMTKYYPGGHPGISKDGFPIWIEMLPLADQTGFYNCVTKKEAVRFLIYRAERLFKVVFPEVSKKVNKRVNRAIFITDLDGLGLKHLWKPALDVFIEFLTIAQAHYPDLLHVCYVINAPSIFPVAYSIVKPFLAEGTQTKIRVMGSDFKEHLLKDIDADQLPVHWGGTATDPDGDPYCRSKVCIGGTVPEKYYRKNMLEENNDLSKFTSVTVQQGSTLQFDYPVTIKNSLLSWNFFTDNNDIAFGIFRRTSSDPNQQTSDMDVIVPSERVNSHVIPEAGRIQCETLGTYVVRFDNHYSWINSKKLFYLIEVVEPDDAKGLKRLD
jgi:hypothetical protein